jgi:hypothetical protein
MELGKNIFVKIDSIDLRHSMLFYLYKSISPNGSINILLKKQIYFLVKTLLHKYLQLSGEKYSNAITAFQRGNEFKKKGIVIDRFK